MTITEAKAPSPGYQLFMLILCVYALLALATRSIRSLRPDTVAILDYADNAVCAVFLIDFLKSMIQAPNKWLYFRRWGWVDLLSSLPMLDIGRWGRAARILRIFRVLRGLRATKMIASLIFRQRAESTVLAAILTASMLLIFCSIAILHFEDVPEGNIASADDALWWAFATVTTVGYGDHYPVTGEGRIVAGILMLGGLALSGTIAAYLAATFIGSESDDSPDIAALRDEVIALREAIERSTSR
jgi:voltage-gated potassium channel